MSLDPAGRPFAVLGIQQVAIGGASKARLRTLWVEMLGLEVVGNFRSERENVDEDICAIGQGAHRVEVDLMEPIDPAGRPAVHATPLNHVGLWIDDLPAAVAWLVARGVRFAPGGIRPRRRGPRRLLPASEVERRIPDRRRRRADRAGPGARRGHRRAAPRAFAMSGENQRPTQDARRR